MDDEQTVCFSESPWATYVQSNEGPASAIHSTGATVSLGHGNDVRSNTAATSYRRVRESFVHRPVPVCPPLDDFLKPVANDNGALTPDTSRSCPSPQCACHSFLSERAQPLFRMASASSQVQVNWDRAGPAARKATGDGGQSPSLLTEKRELFSMVWLVSVCKWVLIGTCLLLLLVALLQGSSWEVLPSWSGMMSTVPLTSMTTVTAAIVINGCMIAVLGYADFRPQEPAGQQRLRSTCQTDPPSATDGWDSTVSLLVTNGVSLVTNGKRLLRIAQEHQLFCQGRQTGPRLPPASVLEQSATNQPRLSDDDGPAASMDNDGGAHTATYSGTMAWAVHAGHLARTVLFRVWTAEYQLLTGTFDHLLSCLPTIEQQDALRQSLDWQLAVFGGPSGAPSAEERGRPPVPRLHLLRLLSARITLLRSHVLTAAMVGCGCQNVSLSLNPPQRAGFAKGRVRSAAAQLLSPCCDSQLRALAAHWALASASCRRAIVQSSQEPIRFLVGDGMQGGGDPPDLSQLLSLTADSASSAQRLLTDASSCLEKTVQMASVDGHETEDAAVKSLKETRVVLADARHSLLVALREVERSDSELRRLLSRQPERNASASTKVASVYEKLDAMAPSSELTASQEGAAVEFEFSPANSSVCEPPSPAHLSVEEQFETVVGPDGPNDDYGRQSKPSARALQLQKLQQADFEAKLDLLSELQSVLKLSKGRGRPTNAN